MITTNTMPTAKSPVRTRRDATTGQALYTYYTQEVPAADGRYSRNVGTGHVYTWVRYNRVTVIVERFQLV